MKRIGAILLALVFFGGCLSLEAQSAASGARKVGQFTLTVEANAPGAQVYVNGELKGDAPLKLSLPKGTYAIAVKAPGYKDFNQSVTLTADARVVANLVPNAEQQRFTLSVNANVKAQVFVDGSFVGNAPAAVSVPKGMHTVTVKAPGYKDFVQQVNVNADVRVDANLQASVSTFNLSVTANVPGAQVFIDGGFVGNAPVVAPLAQGTHSVTVKAPGFNDFNQTVNLNGNARINATLVSANCILTVSANVRGAQVFVDGNFAGNAPVNVSLAQGNYTITVKAPGYADYSQQVSLTGNQTIVAQLQAASYALTVTANVRGAQVFVDRNPAGTAPVTLTLAPGNHLVEVTAPGFGTFSQQVNLTGNQTVAANLAQVTYKLTVNSNVANSQVFLNGDFIGTAQTTRDLPAGNYTVVVRAPGCADYTVKVTLDRDTVINAQMQSQNGRVTIVIPPQYLTKARDALGDIKIIVDGKLLRGGLSFELSAGRHTIVISSGAFQFEITIDVDGGKSYILSLAGGIQISEDRR
jgi:glutaredoxin-related protein